MWGEVIRITCLVSFEVLSLLKIRAGDILLMVEPITPDVANAFEQLNIVLEKAFDESLFEFFDIYNSEGTLCRFPTVGSGRQHVTVNGLHITSSTETGRVFSTH